MGAEFISDVLQPFAVFGGIALIIWASAKAKLEHRKLDIQQWQPHIAPTATPNDSAVVQELRELKQQIAEMQSTGHQFDLSFDAALNRLESRVDRLETRAAAATALTETPTLRNGMTP